MACGPNGCDITKKRAYRGSGAGCTACERSRGRGDVDSTSSATPRSRRVESPVPVTPATMPLGGSVPRPGVQPTLIPTEVPRAESAPARPDPRFTEVLTRRIVEVEKTPLGRAEIISNALGTTRVPVNPGVLRLPSPPPPSMTTPTMPIRPGIGFVPGQMIPPNAALRPAMPAKTPDAPRGETASTRPTTVATVPVVLGPFPPVTPSTPARPSYCDNPAVANTELCRQGAPTLSDYCAQRLVALGSLDALRLDELCTAEVERATGTGIPGTPVVAPIPSGPLTIVPAPALVATAPAATVSAAASKVAPAGAPALSVDTIAQCMQQFLGFSPAQQRAVVLAGRFGNYGMARTIAVDLQNGVSDAAPTFVRWLNTSFQASDPAVMDFCDAVRAVRHGAPVAPAGDPIDAGEGIIMQGAPYAQSVPVDPILDEPTAWKLFWGMPVAAQADILARAFGRMSYPASLAVALRQGRVMLDGAPILSLFYTWAARLPPGAPERTLFRVDVQQMAERLGWQTRPAGDPPDMTFGEDERAAVDALARQQGAAPTEVPPGFTPQSWAALQERNPEQAARLWQAWQSRPSTYAQVSQTILQAGDRVIQGIQAQNTADLARATLDAQHRQALAQIALQAEQARAQRAMAALPADDPQRAALQQQVATMQAQLALVAQQGAQQGAQTSTPPEEPLSTGAKVGIGLAAVAVLGGGGYALSRVLSSRKSDRSERR